MILKIVLFPISIAFIIAIALIVLIELIFHIKGEKYE